MACESHCLPLSQPNLPQSLVRTSRAATTDTPLRLRKSEWRFMFRVFALRQKFQQHRTDSNQPNLTDLECFTAILRQKLSESAQNALDQALKRWDRYNSLVMHFEK